MAVVFDFPVQMSTCPKYIFTGLHISFISTKNDSSSHFMYNFRISTFISLLQALPPPSSFPVTEWVLNYKLNPNIILSSGFQECRHLEKENTERSWYPASIFHQKLMGPAQIRMCSTCFLILIIPIIFIIMILKEFQSDT